MAASDSSPALTLANDFALLFASGLSGEEFERRATGWRKEHLGAAEQARLEARRRLDENADTIIVPLPGRGDRRLPPGPSSAVTAAVVSEFAPRALGQPYLLAICHSRDPLAGEDTRELERVGLSLDRDLALPDVTLMDVADGTFWFVEVVISGGPIHERRRAELLAWAEARGITEAACRFVTAYRSRSDAIFRETVGELARGTAAWFADEPAMALHLSDLSA